MRQRHGTIFRLLKEESGSALLEFAIICILLLMLMFGIAGMGQMLYAYHFVSSVARDASRWAAVNGYTCQAPPIGDNSCNGTAPMNNGPAVQADVAAFVTNHTPQGIDSTQVKTTATWNPAGSNGPPVCATTNNAPGCTVEVQVSYKYTFIFPLISTTPLNLSSTSEMIIAH
jgi:Flp pilus assembly protein TadG